MARVYFMSKLYYSMNQYEHENTVSCYIKRYAYCIDRDNDYSMNHWFKLQYVTFRKILVFDYDTNKSILVVYVTFKNNSRVKEQNKILILEEYLQSWIFGNFLQPCFKIINCTYCLHCGKYLSMIHEHDDPNQL